MGQPNYSNGFAVSVHDHVLDAPLRWKRPARVFVNSMSDLFHEDVPECFIHKVFDIMTKTPQHHYQVLTKRAERLSEISGSLSWPDNVWMGVTVENKDYAYRIDLLRMGPARVKFISMEPLLGPIRDIDLNDIDWVIVGGESGPRARQMRAEWVIDIRNQCMNSGVPFFFKQWGGTNKKRAGRVLEGRTWNQMPEIRSTLGI